MNIVIHTIVSNSIYYGVPLPHTMSYVMLIMPPLSKHMLVCNIHNVYSNGYYNVNKWITPNSLFRWISSDVSAVLELLRVLRGVVASFHLVLVK